MKASTWVLQALALAVTTCRIQEGSGSALLRLARRGIRKEIIKGRGCSGSIPGFGRNLEKKYPSWELVEIPEYLGGGGIVHRGAIRVAWQAVYDYVKFHRKNNSERNDEEALQNVLRFLNGSPTGGSPDA